MRLHNKIRFRVILFVSMIVSMMFCYSPVFADSGKCGDNAFYEITGSSLTISGTGSMYDYACIQTHSINRYESQPWYSYRSSLRTIIIEEGITSIGNLAFAGFRNVQTVQLPSTLTRIGHWAFAYGNSIREIDIPSNVTYIGDVSFMECSSITSVVIPDGVTVIPDSAFCDCSSLQTVSIPNGVTCIGSCAFLRTSISEIILPSSLNEIHNHAFSECKFLQSITIPPNVVQIGRDDSIDDSDGYVFCDCPRLTDIYFTDNAPIIYPNCFWKTNVTVHYPADNPTYTDEIKQDYMSSPDLEGSVTWVPWEESSITDIPSPTPVPEPDTLDLGVSVNWQDSGNRDNLRPDKLVVYLYADGQDTGKNLTLTTSGNWTSRFNNLEKYHNGKIVEYTVFANELNGYGKPIYNLDDNGDIEIRLQHTPVSPTPTLAPTAVTWGFSDVQDSDHPYYKAIYWAAYAGITKGYSDGTFGINKSCTRGEMIMFLWRFAGKPLPKAVWSSPFIDVSMNHSFFKAVLWAYQSGITKGYSDGLFGIDRNVSRGECIMFLWRIKGKPAPQPVSKSAFRDVSNNHPFYNAILWGSQNGITKGYTTGNKKGTFGIDDNCTRGQIVTFLFRSKE